MACSPTSPSTPTVSTRRAIVGPGAALFGAKAVAGACGLLLYARGLHRTLSLLTILYAIGAIGPWLMVYVTH